MSDIVNDLQKKKDELIHLASVELPNLIVKAAEAEIESSFKQESNAFKTGSEKWQPRKNDKQSSKNRDDRRGLLVKSGALRSSIDVVQLGDTISIQSSSEYAQIHNEGLDGKAFGIHPFKMPQRQFMPYVS